MSKQFVLVVDDVEEIRENLAEILELDLGLKTKKAENGQGALAVLANYPINMLITDILMPEMDGIELVCEAKQKHPDLQILLISGGGDLLQNDGGYDYLATASQLTGEVNILRKPFSASQFMDKVASLITES